MIRLRDVERKWMRPALLLVLLLLVIPVGAQEVTPEATPETGPEQGVWPRMALGAASVAFPPDWSMDADAPGSLRVAAAPDVDAVLTLQWYEPGYTYDESSLSNAPDAVLNLDQTANVSSDMITLPTGSALRVLRRRPVESGPEPHLLNFLVPVGERLLGLEMRVVSGQVETRQRLFDQADVVAHTIRVTDAAADGWPRYETTDGAVRVQAPAAWTSETDGPGRLTLQDTDAQLVFTLTSTDIGAPLPVGSFEEQIREAFDGRGAQLQAVTSVNRPVGDMLRAEAVQEVKVAGSAPTSRREYSYYLMRGSRLIIVSLSAPQSSWEDDRVMLLRVLDSLQVPGQGG